MNEQRWRRLRPGDDPVIDKFLGEQVERAHQELAAANDWHRSGRSFVMVPPLPRGHSPMMYAIDHVEIREPQPRERAGWLRATMRVAATLGALGAAAFLALSLVEPALHMVAST